MPENEKERLKWACRRGMLELDLILLPFVEGHYDALSLEQKAVLVKLLSEKDMDLFAWLMHFQPPPTLAYQNLVDKICPMRV